MYTHLTNRAIYQRAERRAMSVTIITTFLLGLLASAPVPALDVPENTWIKVTPTTVIPPNLPGRFEERIYTSMVYNHVTKRIVMWDGYVDSTYPTTIYSNSIWTYDVATNTLRLVKLNNWHNIGGSSYTTVPLPANATDPTPADRHQYNYMAFVPEKTAVYFWGGANRTLPGGHPTDTWAFRLDTDSWTELKPASSPPVTLEGGMVYDTDARKLVLFGGDQSGAGKTYVYDVAANAWNQVNINGASPPWRMGHKLVYDPVRKHTLMFGGGAWPNGGNDLWAFDIATSTWTKISTTFSPPARKFHGFAYDSRHDVFLLFGGRAGEGGAAYYDTWIYNPTSKNWTKQTPIASPTGQTHWVDMDYDPIENVFVAHFAESWWLYRFSATAGDVEPPSAPANPRVE